MRLLSTVFLFALLVLTGCDADNGITSTTDITPTETADISSAHNLKLDETNVSFPFGYGTDVSPYTSPSHPDNTWYNQTYFISVNDMMVNGRMEATGNVIKIQLSRRAPGAVEKMRVDFPHPNGLVDNQVVLCGVEYLENYNPVERTSTRRLYGIDGVFLMDVKDGKREFYLDATFTNTHSIVDATDLLDITGTWRDEPITVVLD